MPSVSPSSTRSKGEEPPSSERPLAELPVRNKLEELLRVARGRQRALILTHDNPDPDSLASAVALAFLLEKRAGLEAQVVYGHNVLGYSIAELAALTGRDRRGLYTRRDRARRRLCA